MNIFDYYHISLLKGLKDFEKKGEIKIPENANNISVEVPPHKFDADISTNVCMVLSGINKRKPIVSVKKPGTIKNKAAKAIDAPEIIS